jgi:serine/threonine-protein kinase
MPVSVGEKLGPYELLALIGAGGMGEVWKARDTRLNREVAIKFSRAEFSDRFQQEANAIAALNHPNICTLFDIGPDYLVMELVEGPMLSDRIKEGPVSLGEALNIARQIADALDAAHQKNVVHRDLKPANIMMSGRGAKLVDFGVAVLTSATDAATLSVAGTSVYMSPEQAEGKMLDARTDIFSFGALLYEMLAGRRAFDSLAAVLRDEPTPLDSPAYGVVLRCLAKAPTQRYQSMAEVRTAIEQCISKPVERQLSIAVLPFANMSTEKSNEYFSDGLAEDVLNALAQIPGLKVIARTSSFAFRGKEQDITEIAGKLRVRMILEGSVRRVGNRIRVTAQLIDATDGSHLWSERYDRELADIFAVQDEIATAIAGTLRVKLTASVSGSEGRKPNLPAYEAFLKGRHYLLAELTPEAYALGRTYMEQAIVLDPLYSCPHAALGVTYLVQAFWGLVPVAETIEQARRHVRRALDLDPEDPQANSVLGSISGLYDYDWPRAGEYFGRAMAADPFDSDTRGEYAGFFLAPLRRLSEAKAELERAIERDPLSYVWRAVLAGILWAQDKYQEAVSEARRALEINEDGWLAYQWMSVSYAGLGMLPEAVDAARNLRRSAPWHRASAGYVAGVLRLAGEDAAELLESASSGGRAMYHLLGGEINLAADWFERAVKEHDFTVMSPASSSLFRPLRESPRWPTLARMMNLPGDIS